MDWCAGHLVVSMEQRFGEQVPNVHPSDSIHNTAAVPSPFNESSETQFGQVLASNGRSAASGVGQGCHIKFAVA